MSIAAAARPTTRVPLGSPSRLRSVPTGRAALPPLLAPPRTVAHDLGVPTLHRTVVDQAHLDHGASTPALVSVRDAVDTALRTYSSVHRGNGYASRITTGWFEEARTEVGEFVGAREDDVVLFTRSTTDSLNLLARCLPAGTTTFVFESEHHAALLPWPEAHCVRLPVPRSVEEVLGRLEAALLAAAEGPRLVVVTGASNVTGELWPVERIVALAHRYDARVALDAAQLAPHRAIDLADSGVDYVAFSGHKVYAPYGAGVLAGRRDWLDTAEPYLRGGGASAQVDGDGVLWHEGSARHEAGSPNVLGAIALAAACAALSAHREAVEEHEADLATRLHTGLEQLPGVTAYRLFGTDVERVGTAVFTVDGLDSGLVSAALSAEYGIAVRDGKFCAHLLTSALLDDAPGAPATAVRASVGLATTREHVDRLLGALARLAARGPAFDYELTAEGWVPVDDPRDLTLPRPW
ncbi:MAG TPA: aminotransferase class V-fold PLP-dependent enzyme [Segeticoccus sp.]|uniref:aminotransferase class V-fold PLP-dependent enzyme n=1 Tax=Segeticoccus sp. TaxID=2706531 RepID=UPI002D7FEE3B|nr:aminotransferase class V-fold PLP-dependent enzyme [Segeticoccus sp.]HET8601136.1 aminotransferase class V-fold PLP-dependent enzyme [Segeticoccus sp.]